METVHDTPADSRHESCAQLTTEKGEKNEEGEVVERSFYAHTAHLQVPMPVSSQWGESGVNLSLGTGTGKVTLIALTAQKFLNWFKLVFSRSSLLFL